MVQDSTAAVNGALNNTSITQGDAQSSQSGEGKRSARQRSNPVDYSEVDKDFDALLEADAASAPAKRQKLSDNDNGGQDEYTQEVETAWAVGFNGMSITEEEEDLLPLGANEARYVHACRISLDDRIAADGEAVAMRNYVLCKWREDVSRYLSEQAATAHVRLDQRQYASVAWRFLNRAGYINYGVAPELLKRSAEVPKNKGTIIVVGAGLAGLAAARQLLSLGYQVVVLEGRNRPGGRVHTMRMEAGGQTANVDLGGSILTGIDGNPLTILAKQLKIPLHEINDVSVPLYLETGEEPSKDFDEKVEAAYNKVLDDCSDLRDVMGDAADNVALATAMDALWQERAASHGLASSSSTGEDADDLGKRLFNWHMANLEFANAAAAKDLSLKSWDQDDPYELPGAHCFLPGGNIKLVEALAKEVPLIYNSKVKHIHASSKGVVISTELHRLKGDAVVVTVPLGVLKRGDISFKPPLPLRKQQAIQRVGFGVLNKVVLLFPHVFWGTLDMFGCIRETTAQRGEFFLFYSYGTISGGPLLVALVSGEAAARFEELTEEEATERVMEVLSSVFRPKGITVPWPLQVACTRWGADEMAYGSYSSMAVGALGGEDYDILAESVGGRIFFAGEATTKKYPATMHGAFCTGLREAANVASTLEKQADDKRLAEDAQRQQQAPGLAPQRSVAVAGMAAAARTACYAAQLAQVFKDKEWPPEVQFGCFAAIIGPMGSPWEGEALLRVDIGAARGRVSAKNLQILLILSTQDLYRLQDVSGGDEACLSFLAGPLGAKLVGRPPLGEEARGLIEAILEQRGIAPPMSTEPVNNWQEAALPASGVQPLQPIYGNGNHQQSSLLKEY